jgi:hypothetical protein
MQQQKKIINLNTKQQKKFKDISFLVFFSLVLLRE